MDIKLFQPEEPVSRKAANERLTAINEAGAADIPYDNTTSKMDADNVQRAIDLTAQSAKEAVDKINQLIGNDGIVNLTVTLSTGKPAAKLPLKVVIGAQTETVTTSEAGKATITIKGGGSATVSMMSDYIDIASGSKTVTAASGTIVSDSMTVTLRNYIELTSSQMVQFSELCTRVDVCCVGGGGGGTAGYTYVIAMKLKGTNSGGGGGYVVTKEKISFTHRKAYSAVVGQGGEGGRTQYEYGGEGGASEFATDNETIRANGGSGADSRSYDGYGVEGNGNGGVGATVGDAPISGKNGTLLGYTGFDTTGLYGGGGGGNGCNSSSGVDVSSVKTGAAGGSPYGGRGGNWNTFGYDGTGPGGGGGGGGYYSGSEDDDFYMGGNGYRGVICLRMWHGEEGA